MNKLEIDRSKFTKLFTKVQHKGEYKNLHKAIESFGITPATYYNILNDWLITVRTLRKIQDEQKTYNNEIKDIDIQKDIKIETRLDELEAELRDIRNNI